jgi:hypothetical protein
MFDKKLELREKLKKTYLIQRLCKSREPMVINGVTFDNPFAFGGGFQNGGIPEAGMNLLRGIFSFDYMGAAEFEWGAVPAALDFLTQVELVAGEYDITKGKVAYYICPKQYEEEVKDRLFGLYHNKIQTKEYVGFKEYYQKDRDPRALGWLEIDNGFLFFGDKEMFEKMKMLFIRKEETNG